MPLGGGFIRVPYPGSAHHSACAYVLLSSPTPSQSNIWVALSGMKGWSRMAQMRNDSDPKKTVSYNSSLLSVLATFQGSSFE